MKLKILLSLLLLFFISVSAYSQGIVITEINYNDPSGGGSGDSLEYIEIQNTTNVSLDFGGYRFTSGVTFIFPSMTVPPMGYVVIAKAATKVQNFYNITGVLQWDAGQSLNNNGGEAIALKDGNFFLLDTVRYNTSAPWPTTANGQGASLMLCDPSLDNNNGANWVAAFAINANTYATIAGFPVMGTPGTACLTLPPYFPVFAPIPFHASFETTWKNGEYLRDIPDTMWNNSPFTGNTSWRRNDDGSSAAWTGTTTGAYTPTGAVSSTRSARFHTAGSLAGQQGSLTLFIDLNTPGTKKLKFWYINTSGSDSLAVWFSQDSGVTFTPLAQYQTTAAWEQKQIILGSTVSPYCMLRFIGTAAAGTTDIGLDEVNVDLLMADDAGVLNIISPGTVVASQTDTVKVVLKNYGGNDLNSVNINWSMNGVLQTPVAYTTTIPMDAVSAPIVLGAYSFPSTGPVSIKTWTDLPNGNADTDPTNDTAVGSTYFQSYATIPFYEGFDSTWVNKQGNHDVPSNYWVGVPYTGISAIRRDDDGATAGWTALTSGQYVLTAAEGTTHSARFHTSGQTGVATASLLLHMDMSTPGFKTLKFWYYSPAGSDSLGVSISTDNGATYSFLAKYLNSVTWDLKSIDLGNVTSSQTIIRFRFSTPNNGQSDLGFDNVKIDVLQPDNAAVASIDAPNPILTTLTDTVKVVIRNFGANALNSCNLNWSIDGNVQAVVPFIGSLAPLTNSNLLTLGGYTFPSSGIAKIKVWTSDPNGVADTDPTNDTAYKSVFFQPYATIPFFEGFDSVWTSKQSTREVPTNFWTNNPITGSNSWRRADDGIAAAWTNGTVGAYAPSGALSTSQSARYHTGGSTGGSSGFLNLYLDLSTPGDKELRFYHINTAGADSMAVWLSTDGGANFAFMIKAQVDANWAQYVVPLVGISSPTTVIRFKATTNNNGNTDVGLDEVSVDLVKPDVGISKILAPVSGCGLVGNDTVIVRVKNFGNMTVVNIPVHSPAGTYIIPDTLHPGDTIDFHVGTITIPASSSLALMVYTTYPDDPNALNDTLETVITHYLPINTFPFVDDYENGNTYYINYIAASQAGVSIQNNIGNQGSKGLLMTGRTAGTWPGNSQTSTTPDQAFGYADHKGEAVTSCMVDATNLASPELRIDVRQTYSAGAAYSYFRVVVNDTIPIPDQTGKPFFNPTTQNADPFVNHHFDLQPFGGQVFKLSLISACKWDQANAQSGIGDNVILDNYSIRAKVPFDAGVAAILSPVSNCGLDNEFLTMRVINYGSQPITNLPMVYSVNGGPINTQFYTSMMNPGDTVNFTFTQLLNLSAPGIYDITAYVGFPDDFDNNNDTVHFQIVNIPLVNTYPHVQDFEGVFPGWTTGVLSGANAWEFGTPAKTILNSAHSTANAWVTGLSQNYGINSDCFVQSPCFDLTGMTEPILSVWLNFSTENNIDGLILEASVGYAAWARVNGDVGFYNNNSAQPPLPGAKWSGSSNGWKQYKTTINSFANVPNVRFRFRFASDATTNDEGFAFDDFRIRQAAVDLVTTWVAPENGCGLGNNELMSVSVYNDGEKTAPYAAFYYTFDGTTNFVDSVGGDILPGQTLAHTTWYSGNLSAIGPYTLSMDVHTQGDGYLANNLVTHEINHLDNINSLFYFNDFENTETHFEFNKNANSSVQKVGNIGWQNSTAVQLKGGAAGTWPTGTENTTTAAQAFGYTDHLSVMKTCELNLASYPSVWMRFLLKQTYSEGANYSFFRVLVNDSIQIASVTGDTIFQPGSSTSDVFVQLWYDLTAFSQANNLHNIVLQAATMYDEGHSSTGVADASIIDEFWIDFPWGIQSHQPMMLSVTPNPTRDLLRVDLFNAPEGNMTLSDMMGRIVMSRQLSGQPSEVLDLQKLPTGIYALTVSTNNGTQTVKVVKE